MISGFSGAIQEHVCEGKMRGELMGDEVSGGKRWRTTCENQKKNS